MHDFFLPNNGVSMNDVLTTAAAGIAGLVAWRQKEKDTQLANRDKTIEDLRSQLALLQAELKHCYEQRQQLADRKLQGD